MISLFFAYLILKILSANLLVARTLNAYICIIFGNPKNLIFLAAILLLIHYDRHLIILAKSIKASYLVPHQFHTTSLYWFFKAWKLFNSHIAIFHKLAYLPAVPNRWVIMIADIIFTFFAIILWELLMWAVIQYGKITAHIFAPTHLHSFLKVHLVPSHVFEQR